MSSKGKSAGLFEHVNTVVEQQEAVAERDYDMAIW